MNELRSPSPRDLGEIPDGEQATPSVAGSQFSKDVLAERRSAPLPGRAALCLVIAFWVIWFLFYTLYAYLNLHERWVATIAPRSFAAASGAALSLGIAAAFENLRTRSLAVRALTAVALSSVATVLHSIVSVQMIWPFFDMAPEAQSSAWEYYTTDFIIRFWYFGSQSGIILALSYAADVRDREKRIRALQALAHSAQLRALRNQLNPHFLFNALNSVAALVGSGRAAEAERMTEDLADFLRMTLALDPQQLITLGEELELQNLYLRVEQVRFPERMQVHIDVPDHLRQALVPSLITQPLVENSLKYAVAQSTEVVTLQIRAAARGEQLELVIEDSGGNAPEARPKGASLGLKNVAERVRLHFGHEAEMKAEPLKGGGFRNEVRIPLRLAGS